MLAAQQRLQCQDHLVIGTTLGAINTRLEATCPYVRACSIPIHPYAASHSNQGERAEDDEAEANRAVFTGVEKIAIE